MNPRPTCNTLLAAVGYDMLRQFFTPAPDSLVALVAKGHKLRWAMLWNLIWLVWMFGDALAGIALPRYWWPVTLATVAIFVLLYACVHVRPLREVTAYAVLVVALACVVMPVSRYASGTCLIYACAFLALQPTIRRTLLRVSPAMAVWALETQLVGWSWEAGVWVVVVALAISIAQHSMWVNVRKNADLRLSHDEVRRLAASAERERIGRDLHDLLGHTLSMVALKSELAGRLLERDPAAARREMAEVEHVARDALAQVRSAVSGIRAAALASEFASARLLLETAGIRMEYWSDGKELTPGVETCLAMVLREAVTNIQRHARAARVEVSVIAGPDQVIMRIRDDGRGGIDSDGNGLTGMRERIAACGGAILIDSPRGKGTAIEVRLPLRRAEREPEPARVAPLAAVPLHRRAGDPA